MTSINKEERIEVRVSARDKQLFRRAQKISGDKSFSSFIVRVLKAYSEEVVHKNDRIIASERDREIFFDAVFRDLEPNEQLLEAAKRYKSKSS